MRMDWSHVEACATPLLRFYGELTAETLHAVGREPSVSTNFCQSLYLIMQANTSMLSKRVAAQWTAP